uniref:Solute carrier family 12 member 9 n=1 Tax=Steinernema glaseri TaxID=37863 RepID=A0A1I7YIJ1_9BILA
MLINENSSCAMVRLIDDSIGLGSDLQWRRLDLRGNRNRDSVHQQRPIRRRRLLIRVARRRHWNGEWGPTKSPALSPDRRRNELHMLYQTELTNSHQHDSAVLPTVVSTDGTEAYTSPTDTNSSPMNRDLRRPSGLSTLSGVFAPVALSMFSVLLFLRMGFVVGQLGFLMTVVELLLAYFIILLTVLSLCAISSNGAIEGGGVYYMISRSLGPEFGGSIGLLFFIANVFSCALYVSGFTEAFLSNFASEELTEGAWKFIYCVCVSIVLLILCLLGSGLFAKTALITFIIIGFCFGSFVATVLFKSETNVPIPIANTYAYQRHINESDPDSELVVNTTEIKYAEFTGFRLATIQENFFSNYTFDYTTGKNTDFALMFAIIFSGVTGLMAGANMSGELARPSVAIPRGTLNAVFTTLSIYIVAAFLVAASCSRELLHNDYGVMMDVNVSKLAILVGIFATTFFSSMSNLIGASRVLNRLAHDKLFGALLSPAAYEVSSGNPVASVIISWICVVLVLMIGAMNKIAKITSIFFLLSYMGVNIATLALELTSAPNFRPTFKYFSWYTCAIGIVSTVTMMLVIDAAMSAIAIVILMVLIMFLHYQAPPGSWGSISQALIYHQVRKYLLLLDVRKEHVKYWRPQILLLVSRPASCCALIDFANDLKKSGLYVIGHVHREGTLSNSDEITSDPLQKVYPFWLSLVDYIKVKAFVELTISPTVRHGVQQLIRLSGLGAMKPNTVVVGFHEVQRSETTLNETKLLKDLKYSKIGRNDVVEYFTNPEHVSSPNEIHGNPNERLGDEEYVSILKDVLHLNKNLCVSRHFTFFDKDMVLKNLNKRYIDVWPVDLLKPDQTGLGWDNSCLFLLQLACILSMSSRWKSATLRVFICVNSLQDMHRRERQLKEMLNNLRIKGKSIVVPWDHVVCHFTDGHTTVKDSADLPRPYISAMNEMVRRHCADTAICFMNLPLPPENIASSGEYLDLLRSLTADLPPTLLVHGLSSVISTAL